MTSQIEKAKTFAALHKKGDPVILFNIWDPGSARVVEAAGAKVIATGSAPVASAHGFADGENIALDMAIDNLKRIVNTVSLPVSVDLEGGYGVSPDMVALTVSRAIEAGAVGFNFEDQIIGGVGLNEIELQAKRIRAARKAADVICSNVFINARTDLFLKARAEEHSDALLDEAFTRCEAYGAAGANGFFAPGLASETHIRRLCDMASLPVNIIAFPHVPNPKTLASLGVSRISYGPVPYRKMSAWLGEQASHAFGAME